MLVLHFALRASGAGLLILAVDVACGQEYPNKPVRIVTTTVGGGLDFMARLIAPGLKDGLGQPVIIENRTNSVVPPEIVSKSQPDGYTLLAIGPPLWIGPLLEKTSYDPVMDFAPVTLAVSSPSILVVHPSLPANSVKELIALAKARPGALNYSMSSTGSTGHLAAELFKSMTGIDVVRVPYKSNVAQVTDLIANQVQFTFGSAGTVGSHLKSGRLRPLAITSAKPSALFPDLPTVAATVPGYEAASMLGFFAPAKTPMPLVRRLHQEIVQVLNRPEVKEKFFNQGVETVGSSPEQFGSTIKSDMARMGKVIKNAGIRLE